MSKDLKIIIAFSVMIYVLSLIILYMIQSADILGFAILLSMLLMIVVAVAVIKDKK